MAEIVEKELSYVLNGCVFDVHNELGPGLREECYQEALEMRLAQERIPFVAKPATRQELIYPGTTADIFEPDLVAANRVILELKVHPEGIPQAAFRQTINYLKFLKIELGLLVNFAEAKADIRRIVFHEAPSPPDENFEFIRDRIAPDVRETLIVVREAIQEVYAAFGLGYSDHTYHRLLEIAFHHRGLTCEGELIAEPEFRERRLPVSPITPLMIEKQILVQVEAIRDGVSARAVRTMQTHLPFIRAALFCYDSVTRS